MEHFSDHDLERYYLGMVPGDSPEEQAIEEHLLWCRECVARAEAGDRYVDVIRAAIIGGNFDLKWKAGKKPGGAHFGPAVGDVHVDWSTGPSFR